MDHTGPMFITKWFPKWTEMHSFSESRTGLGVENYHLENKRKILFDKKRIDYAWLYDISVFQESMYRHILMYTGQMSVFSKLVQP